MESRPVSYTHLLEDVAEELGIDFGKVEFETLNGYLTNLLGHIPTEDDLDKEIVVNGYRFRILSLGNKTIGKVRACLLYTSRCV